MKIKDLIIQLADCELNDEVEIYIHHNHDFVADNDVNLGGVDYFLIEPKVVKDNKWDGLVTIECGKVVGC